MPVIFYNKIQFIDQLRTYLSFPPELYARDPELGLYWSV